MATRRIIKPAAEAAPEAPEHAAVRRVAARELERRRRLPKAVDALAASLHPRQRAFVLSHARRRSTCAGRRSGKTYGLVALALHFAARFPGRTIPVIEKTLTCAAAVMFWETLQAINEQFGLGISFNHSLYRATLPNGACIILAGANTTDECDKRRGDHYPLALVDEAGTYRPAVLAYLIREVLEPALMDDRGTLVLAGTPSIRRDGLFWESCSTPELWEFHHWTFRDNDALPLDHEHLTADERLRLREEDFQLTLARNRETEATPRVQREYFGLWREDTLGLIYRLAPGNHVGVEPPDLGEGEWRFGLGIDFGYEDPTAFVVVGWRRGEPWLWVLESFERTRLIPSAAAAEVDRLRVRYRFQFIVGDLGGYGKGPAEEMRQRFGIPIVAAKKRGKEAHVAFVNGDLASGVIQLVPASNQDLISDLQALRRGEGNEWSEDERDDNHLPDAFLYACMEQRASVGGLRAQKDAPERGSLEWARMRADELEAAMLNRYHREHAPDVDALSQALALMDGTAD